MLDLFCRRRRYVVVLLLFCFVVVLFLCCCSCVVVVVGVFLVLWLFVVVDCLYVDDLLIVSEELHKIIQDLKEKFKLKIKGDGPLEYHLGCDYKLDKDGTLLAQPSKYI